MTGALATLPDSAFATRLSGSAQAGCAASAKAHKSLGDGTLLAPVSGAFGSVTAGAQVDVSGLAGSLDGALKTIAGAVPASVVERIEGMDRAFSGVLDAVGANPVLSRLPEGGALRDVVAQIIDEAVDLLEQRLTQLGESLLGTSELATLREGLTLLSGLRTDYPAHADRLAEFVAQTLLGFDPAVLSPLHARMSVVVDLAARLDDGVLATLGRPVTQAATQAAAAIRSAVDALDPASAASYQTLLGALDAATAAINGAGAAFRPVYDDVAHTFAVLQPAELLAGYLEILDDLELTGHELIGDVLDTTVQLFDELITAVQALTPSAELGTTLGELGRHLRDTVAGSAVGQARGEVVQFLGRIRDTVAEIPLTAARDALRGMLDRVGGEISDLGLANLEETIGKGLDDLAAAAMKACREASDLVQGALTGLLDAIDDLPVADLAGALADAVGRLGGVVDGLHDDASGLIDDLQAQVDSLSQLSFTPVSDEVIGEIDQLKSRLASMNPDALSDEAKLAIRAALAVLEAVDVEDKVVDVLGQGYAELDAKVREVLDDIAAGLERLHRSVGELDPATLLAPVTKELAVVRSTVDSLDAATLTTPLHDQLRHLDSWLATLHPGTVLTPLQGTYDDGVAMIHRLDPEIWGAPLAGLHADLTALAERLDLGPLFTELNDRRRDLIERARDGLTQSLTAADLPEPVAGWLTSVMPLVTGTTELVTLEPGAFLRRLSEQVQADFPVSRLYVPLDEVFTSALAALGSVPEGDLVAAATTVRDAVTTLDDLEPAALLTRLRAAHTRLIGLHAPVLAPFSATAELQAAFHARVDVAVSTPAGEVARVDARFDAVLSLLTGVTDSTVAHALDSAQDAALIALGNAANELAGDSRLDAAQASFVQLRDAVDALVPPSLPRTGPLTASVVLTACEHWRPSLRAAELDQRLTAFAAALAPVADALGEALDAFADDLDATAELIDPLALEPPIAEVFDAVRAQVEALDPTTLLADLRTEVYLPITEAIAALDPHELAARLDATYTKARTGILDEFTGLIDAVTRALNEHLAGVRKAVQDLLGRLDTTLTAATTDVQDVVKRVSDLVFVDLLQRLRQVLENLQHSFDTELRRIARAFDAMLDAAPIGHRIHPRSGTTQAGAA
ncbi:hypothetical protein [Humibacillus xanthopallidus]|uniref:Uncharacterized protein n=1 Tax=Humibacillus xanthopallidus TaxID=412689 RepID=A0A543HUB9_9MICO|nr:hypothetical protein [Humibacillus xanthopallidus]TQM61941.1 hypothetical protein FBY41_1963 [Humibacillus xanthopallidus]